MKKNGTLEAVGTIAGFGLLAVFWAFASPVLAGLIAVFGLPYIVIAGCMNRYKTGSW